MCGSSPSVFQTTPPQPASKARRTLYSLSVGGAEASQNGFGERIPTKSLRRSAITLSLRSLRQNQAVPTIARRDQAPKSPRHRWPITLPPISPDFGIA